MRPRALIAALAAAALALVARAPASAQVIGGCNITTNLGLGIQFGAYDPLGGGALAVVWPVTFYCPFGQFGFNIALGGGNSGNPAARYMTDALNEHLNYNVYLDGAHTIVWGDGTNGTQTYTGGASFQQNYTLDFYGYVPGGQSNVSAYQIFADTIVVTVSF